MEYSIDHKVVKTCTDNGANMVKAFAESEKAKEVARQAEGQAEGQADDSEEDNFAEEISDSDDSELEQVQGRSSGNDDEGAEVDSAGDVLEQEEIENKTVILPDHLRCATHTLNLVATKDSERAMDKAAYKITYRASMAKATALWNTVSRSTKAADAAFELLGYHFTVPVITRWNSYYDSVT